MSEIPVRNKAVLSQILGYDWLKDKDTSEVRAVISQVIAIVKVLKPRRFTATGYRPMKISGITKAYLG